MICPQCFDKDIEKDNIIWDYSGAHLLHGGGSGSLSCRSAWH